MWIPFNRSYSAYPQLPTQQQSNMVILSYLAKKNQNLNSRKKVQYSTKIGGLWLENSINLHFQYYTELFFLEFKFWFFFARQLRVTIEDYCISLNLNNFFLVVLGVVDMYQTLLKIIGCFWDHWSRRRLISGTETLGLILFSLERLLLSLWM